MKFDGTVSLGVLIVDSIDNPWGVDGIIEFRDMSPSVVEEVDTILRRVGVEGIIMDEITTGFGEDFDGEIHDEDDELVARFHIRWVKLPL